MIACECGKRVLPCPMLSLKPNSSTKLSLAFNSRVGISGALFCVRRRGAAITRSNFSRLDDDLGSRGWMRQRSSSSLFLQAKRGMVMVSMGATARVRSRFRFFRFCHRFRCPGIPRHRLLLREGDEKAVVLSLTSGTVGGDAGPVPRGVPIAGLR